MTSSPIRLAADISNGTRQVPPRCRHHKPALLTCTHSDLHAHLNALISSRLPLALPPHTASPDVYLTGLLAFADVYITFEEAWDTVCGPDDSEHRRDNSPATGTASAAADDVWINVPLDGSAVAGSRMMGSVKSGSAARRPSTPSTPPLPSSASSRQPALKMNSPSNEYLDLVDMLRNLRPPGMRRAARLRTDIATLARLPDAGPAVDALLASRRPEPVRRLVGRLERIAGRRSGSDDKGEGGEEMGPHLLLAYACVLYPAVFAGGRWLRSVLAAPGLDFWTRGRPGDDDDDDDDDQHNLARSSSGNMSASGSRPPAADIFDTRVHEKPRSFTAAQQAALERAGLSFWFFAPGGDERGEFARRLGALDGDSDGDDLDTLDEQERAEIVAEARALLECCEELVGALDERVGRGGDVVVVEGSEKEERAKMHRVEAAAGVVGQAWRRGREVIGQAWNNAGGYAGVALAVGCASASLYAMYRSGYWSA
jgi:hypothetical protein